MCCLRDVKITAALLILSALICAIYGTSALDNQAIADMNFTEQWLDRLLQFEAHGNLSKRDAPHHLVKGNKRGYSDSEKKAVLDQHNSFRSREGSSDMVLMVWHDGLAEQAQAYTERCVYAHSEHNSRSKVHGFNYVGENMAATTGSFDALNPVISWFNEKESYDYDTSVCSKLPCGHYTQVVWASSGHLGCGVNFCSKLERWENNAIFYVCLYAPGGNMQGEKMYSKGTPCTKCPASHTECVNNMCAMPGSTGSVVVNSVTALLICLGLAGYIM